jgi:hypothetical protein
MAAADCTMPASPLLTNTIDFPEGGLLGNGCVWGIVVGVSSAAETIFWAAARSAAEVPVADAAPVSDPGFDPLALEQADARSARKTAAANTAPAAARRLDMDLILKPLVRIDPTG